MASVALGVAVCTEVAEHVGPAFADSLVDQLVALSDQIVFTAAVPGQIVGSVMLMSNRIPTGSRSSRCEVMSI
jgi:hypothetical protein